MFLFNGCSKSIDGTKYEKEILENSFSVRDSSIDSLLTNLIDDINSLIKPFQNKKLTLSNQFDPEDTLEIIVIPFKTLSDDLSTSGYSDMQNRCILIQPSYIKSFVKENSLSYGSPIEGFLTLVLLHEMGHFVLGKDGSFDKPQNKKSKVGETDFGLTPEQLTSEKRIELSADSLAILFVNAAIKNRDEKGMSIAMEIQIILPGMEFEVFGKRMIGSFGSRTINVLRDPNNSHPNLELRLAFMNYFLYPNPDKKKMIDEYLYNREIDPEQRQLYPPMIYQKDKTIDADSFIKKMDSLKF